MIAEENGLTDPDTPLVAGTQLTIPDKIFALSNAYDSFQPFDAAGLFGMTPTPKALKPSGLAKAVAKIVGYIVQAIVTIYAGEVAGAAAGAAATNYLTQLFARMENGLFDWGAMVEGTAEVLGFRDLYDGSIGDILNPLSDNKVNSFVETRRSMFNMMNGTGAVEFFKNNGDKSSNFEMMWIDPLAMGMRDYPIDYTSVAISAAAAAVGSVVTQGVGNAYVAAALSSVASYGTTVGLNRVAGRDMEWSWRDVATSALSAVASTAASAQVGDLKGLNADAKNFLARAAGGAATLSVTALTGGKVSAADIVTDVFLMPLANSLVAKLTSPTVDVPAVAGSSAPRTGDQASREVADRIDTNPLENLINLGPLSKEDRLAGIAAYGGADPTFTIGSEGARGWWGVAQSQLGSGASDSQIQARVLQLMTANPGKEVLHTGDVVNVAAGYSDANALAAYNHMDSVYQSNRFADAYFAEHVAMNELQFDASPGLGEGYALGEATTSTSNSSIPIGIRDTGFGTLPPADTSALDSAPGALLNALEYAAMVRRTEMSTLTTFSADFARRQTSGIGLLADDFLLLGFKDDGRHRFLEIWRTG